MFEIFVSFLGLRVERAKETGYFPVLLTTTNDVIVFYFIIFLQQNVLSHFDELVPRGQDDFFGTMEKDSNEEI